MATSHETAPAGSKQSAIDLKRWTVSPSAAGRAQAFLVDVDDADALRARARAFEQRAATVDADTGCAPGRVIQRSSWSPPGCRWPAVPSRTCRGRRGTRC